METIMNTKPIDPFPLWAYKQINVIIGGRINRKRHKTGAYKHINVTCAPKTMHLVSHICYWCMLMDLLAQRRYFQKLQVDEDVFPDPYGIVEGWMM